MKSETPLVDAMIMFMREFKVLGSAESLGVLRKTLNQQQLDSPHVKANLLLQARTPSVTGLLTSS